MLWISLKSGRGKGPLSASVPGTFIQRNSVFVLKLPENWQHQPLVASWACTVSFQILAKWTKARPHHETLFEPWNSVRIICYIHHLTYPISHLTCSIRACSHYSIENFYKFVDIITSIIWVRLFLKSTKKLWERHLCGCFWLEEYSITDGRYGKYDLSQSHHQTILHISLINVIFIFYVMAIAQNMKITSEIPGYSQISLKYGFSLSVCPTHQYSHGLGIAWQINRAVWLSCPVCPVWWWCGETRPLLPASQERRHVSQYSSQTHTLTHRYNFTSRYQHPAIHPPNDASLEHAASQTSHSTVKPHQIINISDTIEIITPFHLQEF